MIGGSQYLRNGRSHYERNKAEYIAKSMERRRKTTEYIRSVKAERGCTDCGIKDWRVLDFDHLPQFEKGGNLSTRAISWSRERVDAEIAKCEVVCANCHRIRTVERRVS